MKRSYSTISKRVYAAGRFEVIASKLFEVVDSRLPRWLVDGVGDVWSDLVGPLDTPALDTFLLAFVLGPIAALIWNAKTDRKVLSANAVENYGGELERFLYTSVNVQRLILVVLDSRKVYVGWPVYLPEPKARRDAPREHFRLLPARSGYLKDDTLEVELVTEYARIYQRIDDERLRNLTYADFQVVIPLDHVLVARPYSLRIPRHLFKMRQGRLEGAEWWSPLHTLLTLLIVWRITRRPTKD